ncbi:ScbR family autoregulator-binding transcription factor [Saccharopolyspora taberi]|uniref:ScbR family autoregulator-binding transcription factor n=1 Tax=Saccharopolyspora taberi TaxID=60895 RepID=A0ABN3VNU3_9PSEU
MPQQRRAQVTRRTILVAAAEEFDREGYRATPLNAILRRGGVTKGAFYFHFASKEAVAQVLIRIQRERWTALFQRWVRSGLDPLSTAVGLVDEVVRLIDDDVVIRAGTALACRREAGGVPLDWERSLTELFAKAADGGQLRPDVDPRAAARVLHAALVGVRALGPGASAADRVAEIWRVLLRGVASADWLRSNP